MINITPDELDRLIGISQTPVLVDVWGTHCAPCKALEELLLRQQDHLLKGISVYKLCASEFPDWSAKQAIRQVPTVLLYLDGRLVRRETQILSDSQLRRFVTSVRCVDIDGDEVDGVDEIGRVDDLILAGDYSGVRTLLDALSGEELRAPAYQRASSMLAMHDMSLALSLKQIRDDFIAMALSHGWELAVKGLYNQALAAPSDNELQSLSFALLDLLPDRLVAQRWRREFYQIK
jgi:thioredoxin-like negative regulator of GroEL